MAIATNAEGSKQAGPREVLCLASLPLGSFAIRSPAMASGEWTLLHLSHTHHLSLDLQCGRCFASRITGCLMRSRGANHGSADLFSTLTSHLAVSAHLWFDQGGSRQRKGTLQRAFTTVHVSGRRDALCVERCSRVAERAEEFRQGDGGHVTRGPPRMVSLPTRQVQRQRTDSLSGSDAPTQTHLPTATPPPLRLALERSPLEAAQALQLHPCHSSTLATWCVGSYYVSLTCLYHFTFNPLPTLFSERRIGFRGTR